jgi:hypothetical protein
LDKVHGVKNNPMEEKEIINKLIKNIEECLENEKMEYMKKYGV